MSYDTVGILVVGRLVQCPLLYRESGFFHHSTVGIAHYRSSRFEQNSLLVSYAYYMLVDRTGQKKQQHTHSVGMKMTCGAKIQSL